MPDLPHILEKLYEENRAGFLELYELAKETGRPL